MSIVKTETQWSNGRKYNIYQITDYTSPDHRIAMSVAFSIQLEDNQIQFLDERFVMKFITEMMDEICEHEKVMIIVDITNFPFIAVSSCHTHEELINDDSDIGVNMNKYYEEFNWENKMFPVLFVNLHISHTGLCVFDYKNKKFFMP